MQTLLDLFHTFHYRGEQCALVYRTGVRRLAYSYRELADFSLRMNGWLAAQGVERGDRVVLWGPNSPWWVVAFWGLTARGAVVVPVDFMSGRERAETIARLTDARLVIQSRFKGEWLTGWPTVMLEELPYLLADTPLLTVTASPKPDDMAQLIYTSGTTGNPKGVILTHRNLMANLLQVNRHIPVVTDRFTFLSLLPLSHMFEQMGGFFTPLYRGSAIVYLRTLKPSAIMEALGEEDIYAVIAVPRLLQLLQNSIVRELAARHLEKPVGWLLERSAGLSPAARRRLFFPLQRKFGSHFTLFVSGGAPLDPAVFRFWSGLGFTVVEGYGLTECAPVLTANTMERQLVGSVGVPLPGVEIRLDERQVLARGENVFPGYYGNDDATRAAFTQDGWFRTGDLGELDGEGWLHIRGREKELIVTGAGINVYPDEVEGVLGRVRGVREGCVIGLDRGGGEEVHAVLILDGSGRPADDIVREANAGLDTLHQITGFSLWPEAEFPKTTTLKVRKFLVKEKLQQGREVTGGVAADLLVALIARATGASPAEIREDAFLVADLGLTSIGRLELVNFLEQEFRLDLEDSLIGPQTRVSDLRALVARREKVESRDRFRFWPNRPWGRLIRMACDLLIHRPLLACFVRLRVEGGERLAGLDGPVLFAANHLSYFDQPTIMFALPGSLRYRTATAVWAEFFFQNFRNIFQQFWKRSTYEYGTIALNLFPLPQTRGFRSSLRFMGRLADHGVNLLVFPEGERSKDGSLLPFKQGLGIMVQELEMPVVPVRIQGLEYVYPRGTLWPKRGDVTVTFGEPLRFRGEGAEEIVVATRRAIEKL